MCLSRNMSKHINKCRPKPTTRSHRRACAQCANTILKIHTYKLKGIPTYGKCGIVIPSADKKQYSAFVEELEAMSLVDGHHLI